jgi:hypothetical protein
MVTAPFSRQCAETRRQIEWAVVPLPEALAGTA